MTHQPHLCAAYPVMCVQEGHMINITALLASPWVYLWAMTRYSPLAFTNMSEDNQAAHTTA